MPVARGTRIYLMGNNTVNKKVKDYCSEVIKFQIRGTLAIPYYKVSYNVASFMSAISYVIIVYSRRDAY